MDKSLFQNIFPDFSPDSKVWIFYNKSIFTKDQQVVVLNEMTDFFKNWQAHGSDLYANATILYDQFLVISVDANQEQASGCSIDKLTQSIKKIEAEIEVQLLDRKWFPIVVEDSIIPVSMGEFMSKRKEAKGFTYIDTSLSKLADFRSNFLTKEDVWYK